MAKKEYPNDDIYERAYIIWMFHRPELRERYLELTLPSIFLNPERRLMIYAMKTLMERSIEITVPNLAMYISSDDPKLVMFLKRHRARRLNEVEISNIIYDTEINTNNLQFFEHVKEYIINYAFARYVEDRMNDINYYNSYPGQHNLNIINSCKSVIRIYDVLNGRLKIERDQLKEAMELINSSDEYIPTCSPKLNLLIGGWTRGYISTLIAKSGHNKSTWIDFDAIYSLGSKRVSSVSVITPEESASTRLRRLIAQFHKISTSAMRQKTVIITAEQIKAVRERIENKYIIYDNVFKYKDVIDLMSNIKSDKIVVDHLQAIDYPGTGDFLARMIGNIPALVDFEKKLAKQNKQVIINLSQVNDKDIQRSDRLIKAPRYWDAFASSVLYQASREFLALWYPWKDQDENSLAITNTKYTINDVRMSVEKSSFSSTGKVNLYYDPEMATFRDLAEMRKTDFTLPKEKGLFDE
jgi:replicative DNA helicase